MGLASMRAFAAISLAGLALTSTSCPGPSSVLGQSALRAEPRLGPVFAALDRQLAERFARDLAAAPAEDEAFVDDVPTTDVAAGEQDVWGPDALEEVAVEEDAQAAETADVADLAKPGSEAVDAGGEASTDVLDGSGIESASSSEEATPKLASLSRETWIYAEPKRKSRRIGYLRAGSVVTRSEKPHGFSGCKGGFYEIEPKGFVCNGRNATLDPSNAIIAASQVRPKRDGLPYDYVMSRTTPPPFYVRLPSLAEQTKVEPDLAHFKRRAKALERSPDFVQLPEPGDVPTELISGGALPALAGAPPRASGALTAGSARLRSGFALLSQFDHDGRRFGVTTDLAAIPLDRTRWVKPSTFQGVQLAEELTLPIAFVMKKRATLFERGDGVGMSAGDALSYRQALGLTGNKERGYLETKEGSWVRADDVRVIEPMGRAPTWAKGSRKWIDVSILQQSLIAYEGTKPVYVTLVSTGADGLGDPKETHSTVQGTFLIHTKHVTVTMDGDEAGDEFDLRDVPFVQYFTEGYAIHAAYWHDDFGRPRSHGCVNMAPTDAAWLFGWTTPEVPADWHGALSLKHGTLVYTHP